LNTIVVHRILISLFICIGTSTISVKAQSNENSEPNITYIIADNLGVGDVSIYNENSKIQTPNLDKMGAEGMKFTDAHTLSSVCTPTCYGILIGKYNWRALLFKKKKK